MSTDPQLEQLPLAALTPYAKNARTHSAAQLAQLVASIQQFGFTNPVLIDAQGGIVAGHGRYLAAQQLGLATVPCLRLAHLTEVQKRAYILADNQLALGAGWDEDLLALELSALSLDGFDLGLTGFDGEELDRLLNGLDVPGPVREGDTEPQTDRAEELRVKWGVETGQLWQMGHHRLLCGDSTRADDVARVMGGDLASLVVTDPPYGVSYASKNAFLNAVDNGDRIETKIENDHLDKAATQALWKSAFAGMNDAMAKGAVVYCFMPQGGDQMMMMMMMMGAGIEPRHELIWLKNNHVLGRTDYAYKHEPILYAWKAGGHRFYGDFQTSILEFARPQKADLHPTMKPVPLIERLIENSSERGAILYEPFSGSGTTIIACENLNRHCRAIEISPGYVGVTLQRFLDHTGIMPVLDK
jgi:DNA modification methylase